MRRRPSSAPTAPGWMWELDTAQRFCPLAPDVSWAEVGGDRPPGCRGCSRKLRERDDPVCRDQLEPGDPDVRPPWEADEPERAPPARAAPRWMSQWSQAGLPCAAHELPVRRGPDRSLPGRWPRLPGKRVDPPVADCGPLPAIARPASAHFPCCTCRARCRAGRRRGGRPSQPPFVARPPNRTPACLERERAPWAEALGTAGVRRGAALGTGTTGGAGAAAFSKTRPAASKRLVWACTPPPHAAGLGRLGRRQVKETACSNRPKRLDARVRRWRRPERDDRPARSRSPGRCGRVTSRDCLLCRQGALTVSDASQKAVKRKPGKPNYASAKRR